MNGPVIFQYTAICGRYEKDRSDIKVFRDAKTDKFVEPVMNAKVYKVLPHQWTDAPYRIWMDGNIFPRKEPHVLMDELLQDNDIAVFMHPWRGCIFEEFAHAKARLKLDHQPSIDEQVARYRSEGMPARFGLAECGVLISRASDATREFFDRWWSEIIRYCARDQMSFPYVWWKMGDRIRLRLIGPCSVRFGEWFEYRNR